VKSRSLWSRSNGPTRAKHSPAHRSGSEMTRRSTTGAAADGDVLGGGDHRIGRRFFCIGATRSITTASSTTTTCRTWSYLHPCIDRMPVPVIEMETARGGRRQRASANVGPTVAKRAGDPFRQVGSRDGSSDAGRPARVSRGLVGRQGDKVDLVPQRSTTAKEGAGDGIVKRGRAARGAARARGVLCE